MLKLCLPRGLDGILPLQFLNLIKLMAKWVPAAEHGSDACSNRSRDREIYKYNRRHCD